MGIPTEIIWNNKVNLSARWLYVVLNEKFGMFENFICDIALMENLSGLTERQVMTAIRSLNRHRFIFAEQMGDGTLRYVLENGPLRLGADQRKPLRGFDLYRVARVSTDRGTPADLGGADHRRKR